MNRIKELRIKHSFSQSELAHKIEKTPQLVSLYEKGEREPKLETWRKMAIIFKVSIPYLQGVAVDRGAFESSVFDYIWGAITENPSSPLAKVLDDYFRVDPITVYPDGDGEAYSSDDFFNEWINWDDGREKLPNLISDEVLSLITAQLYPEYPNGLNSYGSYGEIDAERQISDPYTTPEDEITAILKKYTATLSDGGGVALDSPSSAITYRGKLITETERQRLVADMADMRGDHLNGDD